MKFKKPRGLVSSFRLACEQLKQARGETFQMYVGPLPTPSHLFHFSSLAGIKAILKSRALWASDARLMADKTELTYSASVLRDSATRTGYYFEKVRDKLAEELLQTCMHIASLSLEPCLRSQWTAYADGGRGCAISFDFHEVRKLTDKIGIGSFPLVYNPDVQRGMWDFYLRRAQEIRISRRPPDSFHTEVLRDLAALLFTMKNPVHAGEHEWRLQVSHNPLFTLRKRPDGGCCSELSICTPETICGLLLGPDCPMTVIEAEELLADGGYSNGAAFQLSHLDLK
jgi:Protein of unknown function (DUF2971)